MKLSFNQAFRETWILFKKQWKFVLSSVLLAYGLMGVRSFIDQSTHWLDSGQLIALTSTLLVFGVVSVLVAGLKQIYLQLVNKKTTQFKDLLSQKDKAVTIVLSGLLFQSVSVFRSFSVGIVLSFTAYFFSPSFNLNEQLKQIKNSP